MEVLRIRPATGKTGSKFTLGLPGSKSESNRALILNHISNNTFKVDNLSSAKDTDTLFDLLRKLPELETLDCGPAGTTFRFLTALLAFTPGKRVLTGSERMQQRPVKALVEALQKLGAKIRYLNNSGFPPLEIEGIDPPENAETTVDVSQSSQYLSALLLVAPLFKKGLTVHTTGKLGSAPYIDMTVSLLKMAGFETTVNSGSYTVHPGEFKQASYYVEPDWSAASYWYAWVALHPNTQITLKGMRKDSLQGDRVLAEIFEDLGVTTVFKNNGIQLKNTKKVAGTFEYDFTNCPDLAQTILCVCAGLQIPAKVTGLHSLRIKETDRICAMQTELSKIGVFLSESDPAAETFELSFADVAKIPRLRLLTYDDHRMAMSFAPLVGKLGDLLVENPQVVEKSYPSFWNHLDSVGVSCEKFS